MVNKMNIDEMLFNTLLKIINGIDWEKIINNIKDLQQQNSELKNINDKLSSALNSAEQRIDKAIEYIKKAYQEDEDNKIPLEDLYLKNCTYNPSLVALSILQGEEVK